MLYTRLGQSVDSVPFWFPKIGLLFCWVFEWYNYGAFWHWAWPPLCLSADIIFSRACNLSFRESGGIVGAKSREQPWLMTIMMFYWWAFAGCVLVRRPSGRLLWTANAPLKRRIMPGARIVSFNYLFTFNSTRFFSGFLRPTQITQELRK